MGIDPELLRYQRNVDEMIAIVRGLVRAEPELAGWLNQYAVKKLNEAEKGDDRSDILAWSFSLLGAQVAIQSYRETEAAISEESP